MNPLNQINGLGLTAMALALDNDPGGAEVVVHELVAATDGNLLDIGRVAAAWIDGAAADLGFTPGTVIDLELIDRKTQSGADLADVAPTVAWTARAFGARIARNEQQWTSLIFDLPEQREPLGEHLLTLLHTLVSTIHQVRADTTTSSSAGPDDYAGAILDSVGRTPLPHNGLVPGSQLGDHLGREVQVSESGEPTPEHPSRDWAWRDIVAVTEHPEGPAWRMLITSHGALPVTAVGTYFVREPRHQPAAVNGDV